MARAARLRDTLPKHDRLCERCGRAFLGGAQATFCSPQCRRIAEEHRERNWRCYRCNRRVQRGLYRWVRITARDEAPLCFQVGCEGIKRPIGGWPNPTTRPLRPERFDAVVVRLPDLPPNALLGEIMLRRRIGRIRGEPDYVPLIEAVIALLLDAEPVSLPQRPMQQIHAFRVLDLARALRALGPDPEPGTLDDHIWHCSVCATTRVGCPEGRVLWAKEQGLPGLDVVLAKMGA